MTLVGVFPVHGHRKGLRGVTFPWVFRGLCVPGLPRRHIRIRWWERDATTYRDKFLGSPEWKTHIPDTEITGDRALDYGRTEPPVFLGHYWLTGEPAPLAHNVACLDYSVGRPGGKLAAYRWDGERRLRKEGFVWVARAEL